MEDNRGERLAALESEVRFVKDIVKEINTKLDGLQNTFVTRTEIDIKSDAYEKRIGRIEASLTWAWRALFTGVVWWLAALIGVIFEIVRGGK